jgi:transglutaminase-like putative cysteine protease
LLAAAAFAAGPNQRHFEIEYRVEVTGVPKGESVDIWVPAPRPDPYQQILRRQVDSHWRYRVTSGQETNQFLFVRANSDGEIRMTIEAVRKERFARLQPSRPPGDDPGPSCCLHPDRLVPLDERVRGWAREVVQQAGAASDLEMARAIYNHIVATVKYDKSGKGWGRGDIFYAFDTRRGNCTDFHAIFIGYCRSLGIPARFAIGVPLPPKRGRGQIQGYHCWAEFYAKGLGWVPVDASEAAKDPSRRDYFFGAHDANRLEFSRGRDVHLAPHQRGEPINFFIDAYAELDGKPFPGVKSAVSFRDLD